MDRYEWVYGVLSEVLRCLKLGAKHVGDNLVNKIHN
jgi:hypothetical protein